jgi:hypothetical protein
MHTDEIVVSTRYSTLLEQTVGERAGRYSRKRGIKKYYRAS